jgi:hypothetical protein
VRVRVFINSKIARNTPGGTVAALACPNAIATRSFLYYLGNVHNPVIAKSLTRIRNKPWEAATAFLLWLVIETTKHRLFTWLNSRIDRESDAVIRLLRVVVSWIVVHPIEFALVIATSYCLIVVINAQVAVGRDKQPPVLAAKRGEIGFVHPGEPLGQRWTPNIPGAARPLFFPLPGAPVANSVAIEGPWDPGIDHEIAPYPGFSKRLKYVASFPGHAAVYTYIRVLGPDGATHHKWLQHVLGRGDEPIADMDMKDERKIFVNGKPLKDGWLSFVLSLPDEVQRAYARERFSYSALIKIRLRGSLHISPIELYED